MSEALALQRPAVALPWRLLRLLPGVALLFSIGYTGKLAEALVKDYGKAHHLALPNIEYVLWAILIGVVIELGVAIAIMTLLGRWFKLKPKLTSLLAVGSSICGVSAIIAAKGAIEADDDDATFAIAAILALG